MYQATIVYGKQCCKKAILCQIGAMDEDGMSMNLQVVIISFHCIHADEVSKQVAALKILAVAIKGELGYICEEYNSVSSIVNGIQYLWLVRKHFLIVFIIMQFYTTT